MKQNFNPGATFGTFERPNEQRPASDTPLAETDLMTLKGLGDIEVADLLD